MTESWGNPAIFVLVGLLLLLAGAGIYGVWRRFSGGYDQFRRAYENGPDATQIIDANGKVVFRNRAFQANFGTTKLGFPELLRPNALANPESLERLQEIEGAAKDGREWQCVLRLTPPSPSSEISGTRYDQGQNRPSALPSGSEAAWCRLSVLSLKGRPAATLWRLKFLGLDHRDEALLAQERARLASLLSETDLGLAAVDGDGRILFLNEAFARLLDVVPRDVAEEQRFFQDFLAERTGDGEEPTQDELERLFEEPNKLEGEARLRSAGGELHEVDLHIAKGNSTGGAGAPILISCRDLSVRRAQEEAIVQAEKHLESSFRQAPVGIAISDSQGQIREANAALGAFLGVTFPNNLKGRQLEEFLIPDDRKLLEEAFEELRNTGKGSSQPLAIRLASEKAASFWLVPIDAAGGQRNCFAYLVDTTEQRDLELRFSQAQKMQAIGQLAGGIAHDFNNLLTAMIGFSDLLLLRHRPGDQSFADIMQIKQNANRAANLVRQLLAFSRQQTLQPRMLNLTDVLTELIYLLRRLMGERTKLEVKHGRDLGMVRADKGQIEQVITNLAVNARDAMPEGGKLSIATANETLEQDRGGPGDRIPAGSYVTIQVRDQGTGIPKADLEKIFEPFYSTKAVGAGTGLGLSTVHGIVKQSGGYIFVESEEGKGTAFKIYLPRHAAEQPVEAPKSEDAKKRDLSGNGRVLLVEDETAVRNFSARVLRNKGYEVLEAASGENALAVLEETPRGVDLVVTDVVMPNMDGPQLVKELRRRDPDIKVIFISGYAEETFRAELDQDQSQNVHFLPKPFNLRELAAKVKEVIGSGIAQARTGSDPR